MRPDSSEVEPTIAEGTRPGPGSTAMKAADRREAALERGVDDLQNLLEYIFRDRPRALRYAQERYVKFALVIYRAIEKADP